MLSFRIFLFLSLTCGFNIGMYIYYVCMYIWHVYYKLNNAKEQKVYNEIISYDCLTFNSVLLNAPNLSVWWASFFFHAKAYLLYTHLIFICIHIYVQHLKAESWGNDDTCFHIANTFALITVIFTIQIYNNLFSHSHFDVPILIHSFLFYCCIKNIGTCISKYSCLHKYSATILFKKTHGFWLIMVRSSHKVYTHKLS